MSNAVICGVTRLASTISAQPIEGKNNPSVSLNSILYLKSFYCPYISTVTLTIIFGKEFKILKC